MSRSDCGKESFELLFCYWFIQNFGEYAVNELIFDPTFYGFETCTPCPRENLGDDQEMGLEPRRKGARNDSYISWLLITNT